MSENAIIEEKPESHLNPENWRDLFVASYANTGNKRYSAGMAGIAIRTVYYEIEKNPEFAQEVELAKQEAIMELHMEARNRAMQGEPIFDSEGTEIGRRGGSDKLLIFMLSSLDPDNYGIGAIQASKRNSEVDIKNASVTVILPENFRGKITIGREDTFPDADILDAEFTDVDSKNNKLEGVRDSNQAPQLDSENSGDSE